jgi:hypothetical protein
MVPSKICFSGTPAAIASPGLAEFYHREAARCAAVFALRATFLKYSGGYSRFLLETRRRITTAEGINAAKPKYTLILANIMRSGLVSNMPNRRRLSAQITMRRY